MAACELDDLVRCNVDACALEVEVEEEGWAIKITDRVRHEWSRVKAAVCSSALQRFSHMAPLLVCEAAAGSDGALGPFPGYSRAPQRHRSARSPQASTGGTPSPLRDPLSCSVDDAPRPAGTPKCVKITYPSQESASKTRTLQQKVRRQGRGGRMSVFCVKNVSP